MNLRRLFLEHVAQTSASPLGIEIKKAKGTRLWDSDGKEFIDLIAGISVCNVGHRHPRVIKAIKQQLDDYMHVLVYGEMIESPQVQYAKALTEQLPPSLNSVYFTNSGAEAVEGALKLAKRSTNRVGIVAFKNSYHGSTQGALSVIGDEEWRNAFRPLLPGVLHLEYNSFDDLKHINSSTACVIVESVQAEAGVILPAKGWMQAIKNKCTETGSLLILDEIQTGFGRTGSLWFFEQLGIVPDILLLGKALGGGMPLGAFVSDKAIMWQLTNAPVLGHITTFGGHPVCCAAGLAALKVLLEEKIIKDIREKENLFMKLLWHPLIRSVHSSGLLIAVEFDSFELNKRVIGACIKEGVLTDWFLFAPHCLRIAPPLTISKKDIKKACAIIIAALDLHTLMASNDSITLE
jgi:acetylornithine/N-succinyldiaminopimelate aminotransferase